MGAGGQAASDILPCMGNGRMRLLVLCAAAGSLISCSSSAASAPAGPPARRPPDRVASSVASTASTASPAQTADGSSIDQAIVVTRDREREGVEWENAWIREHFGRFQLKQQRLILKEDGRPVDEIIVELSDGTIKTLYFDITRSFGRY